jgi:hypothetical protein
MSRSKNNPRPPSKSRLRRKRQLRRRRRRNRRLRKQQARYAAYFDGVSWHKVSAAMGQLAAAVRASSASYKQMAQSLHSLWQSTFLGTESRGVKVPGWERPSNEVDYTTDKIKVQLTAQPQKAFGLIGAGMKRPGIYSPDATFWRVEFVGVWVKEVEVFKHTISWDAYGNRIHEATLVSRDVQLADLAPGQSFKLGLAKWDAVVVDQQVQSKPDEAVEVTLKVVSVETIRQQGVQVAGISPPASGNVPRRFTGDERVDTSGDVPDVPDYAWGWRLFRVQLFDEDVNVMVYARVDPAFTLDAARRGRLLSWGKSYVWEEKRGTAECLYGREGKEFYAGYPSATLLRTNPVHRDQAPDPYCDCGFWATWHPQDLPLGGKGYNQDCVVAKVKAWGDIVEAPRGFRAQHMEIVEVALVGEEGEATLGEVGQMSSLLMAVMNKYRVGVLSELIQENEPT